MKPDNDGILDIPMDRSQVIRQLNNMGLTPQSIQTMTGTPVAIVQTVIRKAVADEPLDEEMQSAIKLLQMNTLRFINREMVYGSHESKLLFSKIVLGRMLSKQTGEEDERIEEMRTAWLEIQDEQRTLSPGARLYSVIDLDDDDDED